MGGSHSAKFADKFLVSTQELAAELFEGEAKQEEFKLKKDVTKHVRVLDASLGGKAAKDKFLETAIPTACFVDVMTELADKSGKFPNTLPTPEIVKTVMENLGIGKNDNIVLYGQQGKISGATRAYFILSVYGFKNVRVLDGGLKKYVDEGLPTVKGEEYTGAKSKVTGLKLPQHKVAYYEEMKEFSEGKLPDIQLVDCRPASGFNGNADDNIEGCRQGNIPGAINVPASELLNADTQTFKNEEEIKQIVEKYNIDPAKRTITMCRTGVAASSGYFAFLRSGFKHLEIYDGSWSEFGSL
uniref:Rhodanese domain-containing protein n=1 Tax=Euplotes harpa TaxID=151035 RepID=A0A7S3NA63_9SPIT|mmetsp:Transcript_39393/g.45231  ORF Transcript_39393/g.45231 Transcript_39393/m.45231 type:complete len:299 (+) Transcript_39393:16-912(+)